MISHHVAVFSLILLHLRPTTSPAADPIKAEITPQLEQFIANLLPLNLMNRHNIPYAYTLFDHFYEDFEEKGIGTDRDSSRVPVFFQDMSLLPETFVTARATVYRIALKEHWDGYRQLGARRVIEEHIVDVPEIGRPLLGEYHLLGKHRPGLGPGQIPYSVLKDELMAYISLYDQRVFKVDRSRYFTERRNSCRKRLLKVRLIIGLTVFADFLQRIGGGAAVPAEQQQIDFGHNETENVVEDAALVGGNDAKTTAKSVDYDNFLKSLDSTEDAMAFLGDWFKNKKTTGKQMVSTVAQEDQPVSPAIQKHDEFDDFLASIEFYPKNPIQPVPVERDDFDDFLASIEFYPIEAKQTTKKRKHHNVDPAEEDPGHRGKRPRRVHHRHRG